MTKKQLIIAIITFVLGFAITFYVIRTYFPKHKTEKTVQANDTLTKSNQ